MAEPAPLRVLAFFSAIYLCTTTVQSQVLTPPYFNLAVGKRVHATSTCGVNVPEKELYCKLTGANPGRGAENQPNFVRNFEVIQGQLCDYCDTNSGNQAHPAENVLDGTEKWWQSPPLSRGLQFNEVNLTIDLGQEFHVAYVLIKMGNSPRPGVFALERSTDYGQTWEPWQYFADTLSDCRTFFGDNYERSITRDDSVICTTEYSKVVPLEGGEIVVSLVNERPSAYNFSYASTLQEWTRATNLRMRLLRTKTLLGHLMAIVRQDPTVTRRYFYSIKDISIGGRCVCNGHASVCDKTDVSDPYKLLCRCVHNTCGSQCETCCPGFVQKPWRPATTSNENACEPCNCHGHSNECYYDEDVDHQGRSLDIHGRYSGGGVCENCRDYTEGINCERCQAGYYRPRGVLPDARNACQQCRCDPTYSTGECEQDTGRCLCRPEYTGLYCDECNVGYYGYPHCIACECNVNGTQGAVCEVGGGQCPCKPNYDGGNCDRCAYGYYNFPECRPCACDRLGSHGQSCDAYTGECTCKINFGGRACEQCANGHYDYPTCQICNCDPTGSEEEICDKVTGNCLCKPGFGGYRCDRCDQGFYRYPNCMECGCQSPGYKLNDCDNYGQCICHDSFEGLTCDRCARGYFNYPECTACNCDRHGSYNGSCDAYSGQCYCRQTFEGTTCDRCKPNFYRYPVCEECNCNPAGAKEVPGYPLGGCGAHITDLLCECKDRVEGHICDQCKPGYWNLDMNNPLGCEDCGCHRPGSTGGVKVCDTEGRCLCKPFVSGRSCQQCEDGTYNLQEHNVFGCTGCGCDIGGSSSQVCDKISGNCQCHPRVDGRRCDRPLNQHYFPSLHQHKYEMEDGHTPSGGPVRYDFNNAVFEGYSWRGYAIFSRLQDEVLVDVDIQKPLLYRLIFRYVSRNVASVTAEVTMTPMTSTDVQQTSMVIFNPAFRPEFVTVSGTGAFVLSPGKWTISLKTPESIFVDYLVVLPQSYYEGTILQEHVHTPCKVPADNQPCLHYVYVDASSYSIVEGESGYTTRGSEREPTQRYPDDDVCKELGTNNMAHINSQQTNLHLAVPVPAPGRYVFVVQYHSDDSTSLQDLEVDITTRTQNVQGRLIFPTCPYSSLCRRLISDTNGDMLVVDVEGTHASVSLMGRSNIDVAIDSIIAIPVEEWGVEFIQPRLKCIRINKQCIQSTFVHPTGSTTVEFESGPNEGRVATDVPAHIIDTSVKVIKVDSVAPTVNVKASVISEGRHVFVVHYFQPHYLGFDVFVNVSVESQLKRGKFRADYCPGVSGCRSVVKFEDSEDDVTVNLPGIDVFVTVRNPSGRPLWLDYITVIPRVHYNDDVLDVMPVDRASTFLTECGQNNFHVEPDVEGFCRDSIFSLTTAYNNGVMECNCNPDGSTSLMCDEFGGQCTCKDDVIGRTCAQCRTGFYGFPNCQPCNCPSGLCDPRSGQCVCPPRVTGERCNTCLPRTFGFNPLIGCEDCNCDPSGVLNNELECDVDIGTCNCRPNVGGRRCNRCLDGHYSFPRCIPCNCDQRGTTDEICDQRDATCLCKDNVGGPLCEQCNPGTFYLEERNPQGCTHCFCFGTTTRCDQSDYRRSQVHDMQGWGITNLFTPEQQNNGRTLTVDVDFQDMIDPREPLYWVAPEPYLGNKITSYGGKLFYTVKFTHAENVDSRGYVKPDVRMEGNNMTLVHTASRQPAPEEALEVELDLLETQFRHEETGALVNREQFMTMLAGIRSLQIRASYYTVVTHVELSDVLMDVATRDGTGSLARNVEQCTCPPNYKGTSCEECADGYYRSQSGPYMGVCVACQCNGKADSCDPATGECTNCRDNYGGPQCLACRQGYYQDRYTGRCVICACPMALESNNFASTCEVDNTGAVFRCICLPGYIGPRCDMCDSGYHGNPNEIGGRCEQCQCNGNIDPRDPRSCDPYTGECLLCIHDTDGRNCQQCSDWYFGDAIVEKDCSACSCNRVGSERCDHSSGICLCRPNVVGPDCDQCAPGTYGFHSGTGCRECGCGAGSHSSECDEATGQCQCQPGVTGLRCDKCQPGFWDYTPLGCRKCECKEDGATSCDAATGRCTCLPGVTGPRCDQCLDRWVLIPQLGCQECDSCVNLLIDDTDVLISNVTEIMKDLDHVSVGVAALKRLERINTTVHELRPLVDTLTPNKNPLDPLMKEMEKMKDKSNKVKDAAERALREAEVLEGDASDTLTDTDELETVIDEGVKAARDAVKFAQDVLDDILSNIHNQNVDKLIREAERILEEIRLRTFDNNIILVDEEMVDALDTLQRVKDYEQRVVDQNGELAAVKGQIDDVSRRLYDLINQSRNSSDSSRSAQDYVNRGNRVSDTIKADISNINNLKDSSRMMVDMARDLLEKGLDDLDGARRVYDSVEEQLSKLDAAMGSLSDFTEDLDEQNKILKPLVDNATLHAYSLENEALFLDSMIADTRSLAEGALNASRAYQAIVDAINDAENASKQANEAAANAQSKSNGVSDQARESRILSETLETDAEDVVFKVQDNLKDRLRQAEDNLMFETDMNNENKDKLVTLLVQLDKLPAEGYSEEAQEAANKAMEAKDKATEAESKVTTIVDQLPNDRLRVDQIPTDISNANRDIQRAKTNVERVKDQIPQAKAMIDTLMISADKVTMMGNNLRANLSELRHNIDLAREEASRIRVGLSSKDNTVLQVRNPQNLEQAGSYTKLSLYFNTKERDGFLAYIGPVATAGRQVDFYALEIIDGQATLKLNLGDGVTTITNPKFVSDGVWHQVVAERTGQTASIKVRTEDEPDAVQSDTTTGFYSVLDLKADMTKFYVGGAPDSANLGSILKSTHYVGSIEDILFDGVPVGVWDFIEGEENSYGAMQRNALVGVTTNGYRFNGDGYVILEKGRFNPGRQTSITLKFKTYAKNGLMFLIGGGDPGNSDFLSIEMNEGKVLMQYDLGSGTAKMETPEIYNDGKWHTLFGSRINRKGIVKIDGVAVATATSSGRASELTMDENVFIGGYKGNHNYKFVTNQGFDGCIKDIKLGRTSRDININKVAKGVVRGCPQVARTVTFPTDAENAYIAMDPVDVNQNFKATMKVKSLQEDGLIMYIADDTQTNSFGLQMNEGRIVISSNADGKVTHLKSDTSSYNDGRWHYITVTKNGRELRLSIDDLELVDGRSEGRKRLPTTSPVYFGGVPDGYRLMDDNVLSTQRFIGCIGDVTIHGNFINFALAPSGGRGGASLAGCPIPDPTPTTETPTQAPPPLQLVTQDPGQFVTDSSEQCALPQVPAQTDDTSNGDVTCFHFSSHPESRIEFDSVPESFKSNTSDQSEFERSNFSMEIKTTSPDGLLFYVADIRQVDYIAVFMVGGNVVYSFNCGSGPGRIASPGTYNDGQWHKIEFLRRSRKGTLIIDGSKVGEGRSEGATRSININPPYYVGSLTAELAASSTDNLEHSFRHFLGSIRQIQQFGNDFGPPDRKFQVSPCSSNSEDGTFFHASGGYVKLDDIFKVGRDLKISMEIRPRSQSGVLLSVTSMQGDYLIIQMINGVIHFSVNNGAGEIATESTNGAANALCDGEWHTIQATKAKNVITLLVDGRSSTPAIGENADSTSADTEDPLYVGGVPDYIIDLLYDPDYENNGSRNPSSSDPALHHALKTKSNYVGCIRNVMIRDETRSLGSGVPTGDVSDACPTH